MHDNQASEPTILEPKFITDCLNAIPLIYEIVKDIEVLTISHVYMKLQGKHTITEEHIRRFVQIPLVLEVTNIAKMIMRDMNNLFRRIDTVIPHKNSNVVMREKRGIEYFDIKGSLQTYLILLRPLLKRSIDLCYLVKHPEDYQRFHDYINWVVKDTNKNPAEQKVLKQDFKDKYSTKNLRDWSGLTDKEKIAKGFVICLKESNQILRFSDNDLVFAISTFIDDLNQKAHANNIITDYFLEAKRIQRYEPVRTQCFCLGALYYIYECSNLILDNLSISDNQNLKVKVNTNWENFTTLHNAFCAMTKRLNRLIATEVSEVETSQ